MKRSVVVGALGTAQTLAWGSSYYLPAIPRSVDGLDSGRWKPRVPRAGSHPTSPFVGAIAGVRFGAILSVRRSPD